MEDLQYTFCLIGKIKGGVELNHIIKYCIPFYYKVRTPTIIKGLSKEIPIDTLYFDLMESHSKYFKDT